MDVDVVCTKVNLHYGESHETRNSPEEKFNF